MCAAWYFKLRDSGKVQSKAIVLNDGELVVESFKYEGVYYLAISSVDVHAETSKTEILSFWDSESANKFFTDYIKTNKFRFAIKM